MHPRFHAAQRPEHPAVIMAGSGSTLTYRELESRANQGAHLLRRRGVKNGDTIAIWLPNCMSYLEVYWAAQRAGLRVAPISTALTAGEAAYILQDSGARMLVTSAAIRALETLLRDFRSDLTSLNSILSLDEDIVDVASWRAETSTEPTTPIDDERPGSYFFYSSGTTGRPKGIKSALLEGPAIRASQLAEDHKQRFSESAQTRSI